MSWTAGNGNKPANKSGGPCDFQDVVDPFDLVMIRFAAALTHLQASYPVYDDMIALRNADNVVKFTTFLNLKPAGSPYTYRYLLGYVLRSCPQTCDEFDQLPPGTYEKTVDTLLQNAIHDGKVYDVEVYLPEYRSGRNSLPRKFCHLLWDHRGRVQAFELGTDDMVHDIGIEEKDTSSVQLFVLSPGDVKGSGSLTYQLPCAGGYSGGGWGGSSGNGNGNDPETDDDNLEPLGPVIWPNNGTGITVMLNSYKINSVFENLGKSDICFFVKAFNLTTGASTPAGDENRLFVKFDKLPSSGIGSSHYAVKYIASYWTDYHPKLWLLIYERDGWPAGRKTFQVWTTGLYYYPRMKYNTDYYFLSTVPFDYYATYTSLINALPYASISQTLYGSFGDQFSVIISQ